LIKRRLSEPALVSIAVDQNSNDEDYARNSDSDYNPDCNDWKQ